MTPAECKNALEGNLAESIQSAIDLDALLDQERQALERQDTTELNDVAMQKRLNVIRLDELDKIRKELCVKCGVDDSIDSVHKLLDGCDENGAILSSWERFLDALDGCSDKNSSNGAIIRVRQTQVNDAIGLLRNGTTDTPTYGPKGYSTDRNNARALAEA